MYVVEDINTDILQQHGVQCDFVEAMRSLHFVSLITLSTRVTTHSATLLDQMWTNQPQEAKSGVIKLFTTDHNPIIASIYYY